MEKNRKLSKYLCLLLRHKPEKANLSMDKNGWVNINELIKNVPDLTRDILSDIVSTDNKDRYSYDQHGLRIRCNQGHSVDVDVELKKCYPPTVLYHGTSSKFLNSIFDNGLKPQTRQYVHLSEDNDTATNVGKRHGGQTVILIIDCHEMNDDGYEFYCSKNNVWLTKYVPSKYINILGA